MVWAQPSHVLNSQSGYGSHHIPSSEEIKETIINSTYFLINIQYSSITIQSSGLYFSGLKFYLISLSIQQIIPSF